LFAIEQYSLNSDKSQREIADETRIKFGLATFSHSTLCRVFKNLEGFIEKLTEDGYEMNINEKADTDSDIVLHPQPKKMRQMPSVKDTADRRKKPRRFLMDFSKNIKKHDIENSCRNLAEYWFCKTSRLLI